MTKNLDTVLRKKIIAQVKLMKDVELKNLEKMLDASQAKAAENALIAKFATPIKEKIDLEELIIAQNYMGPDKIRFEKLVKELDIQEPIESLLAMLSK
jgi:hypothetical protein